MGDPTAYETFLTLDKDWDLSLHLFYLFKETSKPKVRIQMTTVIGNKSSDMSSLLSTTENIPGKISPFGKQIIINSKSNLKS